MHRLTKVIICTKAYTKWIHSNTDHNTIWRWYSSEQRLLIFGFFSLTKALVMIEPFKQNNMSLGGGNSSLVRIRSLPLQRRKFFTRGCTISIDDNYCWGKNTYDTVDPVYTVKIQHLVKNFQTSAKHAVKPNNTLTTLPEHGKLANSDLNMRGVVSSGTLLLVLLMETEAKIKQIYSFKYFF